MLFRSANGGDDEYWIGSADLMHRNLDRRVEALVRIEQKEHKDIIKKVIDAQLTDSVPCWIMQPDGTWMHRTENINGVALEDFHTQTINWYKSGDN